MFECLKKKVCFNYPQRCPACHACADMMMPYPLFKDRDLVEVVRCKDCRHSALTSIDGVLYCFKVNNTVKREDFCSYGEKREATNGPQ